MSYLRHAKHCSEITHNMYMHVRSTASSGAYCYYLCLAVEEAKQKS